MSRLRILLLSIVVLSGQVLYGACPLRISTSKLPPGVQSSAYSQQFTSVCGVLPVAWSVASGTLPNGLSVSSAGLLSGTPTQNGVFPFIIKVTDSNGASHLRNEVLSIAATTGHSTALTWTTSVDHNIAFQSVYRGTVSGGPYTVLSAGSNLDPSLLSFTDVFVTTGTYYYVIRCTDLNGVESGNSNEIQIIIP